MIELKYRADFQQVINLEFPLQVSTSHFGGCHTSFTTRSRQQCLLSVHMSYAQGPSDRTRRLISRRGLARILSHGKPSEGTLALVSR